MIKKVINHVKALIAHQINKISTYSKNNNNVIFNLSKYRSQNLNAENFELNEDIGISIVTYNSKKWINNFFKSLETSGINFSKTELLICDNGSTDGTLEELQTIIKNYNFKLINIVESSNIGFGSGHNKNINICKSEFILITNVDIEFEQDSISLVLNKAQKAIQKIATWELRQIPYEHPKYYDPVTLLTNWNSHACILMRTKIIKKLGGYDENIFMYGEDVELSYRLRENNYLLSYVPKAVITHNTYENAGQIKPIQYKGSAFANWYIRVKYGNFFDILAIPKLYFKILNQSEPYLNAHKDIRDSFKNFKQIFLKTLLNKKYFNENKFGFYDYDYEFIKDGAFYRIKKPLKNGPLVSVITRTYPGREHFLKQAVISVKNQTYSNIEHIIIEDGGNTYQNLFTAENKIESIIYRAEQKVGRSIAGNIGLSLSKGEYILFLDDDDLLFSDHIEILLSELLTTSDSVAAYTPSIEVKTDYYKFNYEERGISKPILLKNNFDYEKLLKANFITIQSILFQKNLFETRGGINEKLDFFEDWNLWLRYGKLNNFKYIEKSTSLYRVPADNFKNTQRKKLFDIAYHEVVSINIENLKDIKESTDININNF